MERIGIYGGSYNPPHLGHVRGAACALEALKLDKLLMIPARAVPHKQLPDGSPDPQQRLEMVRLAVGERAKLCVSDLELKREGPSYTWETVEQLHDLYPDAQLVLIMGTDMFLSFHNWRETERITALASIAVLCRGEKGEKEAIARQKAFLESRGVTVATLDNPVMAISSTDLRRLLALGCGREHIPADTLDYIRSHGLYGAGKNLKNLSEAELENAVIGLLNPNRVAHVRGCRQAAVELARRWGADETDAARAALLHDVTKALDGPLQLTLCREYGIILDNFSSQNPKTLHALTGSFVAERIFGENEAVVSAIRSHTTGKADMNLLETIIYVADYMEPNRDFPGVDELRALAYSDIRKALKLGLTMTLDMLKKQNRQISPESRDALRFLEEAGV